MAAPAYSTGTYGWSTRAVMQFGGLALPNGGGTMSYYDLNDTVAWNGQELTIGGSYIQNQAGQQLYLGRGTWLSQDMVGRTIDYTAIYDEQGNAVGNTTTYKALSVARATLSQAGEQYLTFDNNTGIRCRLDKFESKVNSYTGTGFLYDCTISFQSRNPYAEDLSVTTQNVGAVSGSFSGTSNPFTVSYPGTMYTPPIFTLTIPSGNTVTISSVVLANTTSGETLTLSFNPVITANTAHSVVIDSSLFKATLDGNWTTPNGTFPSLYPGNANPYTNRFTLTITSSAATTGCTFALTSTTHWDL